MKFANYTQFYTDRKQLGIEYAAAHAAALGFDAVEYFGKVPTGIYQNAAAERHILSEYGLEVACYSVYVQLLTDNASEVKRQMAQEIEAASLLESKYFHHTIFPHYSLISDSSYEQVLFEVIELVEFIAKECNRKGIVCLYEPQGAYFNGRCGLGGLLSEIKIRGYDVGICGDMGNSFFVDVDPKDIFGQFANDIRHVHIKDYLVTTEKIAEKPPHMSLSGRFIYDAKLGEGSVDIGYCFDMLRANDYDGAISFEIEGDDEYLRDALATVKAMWKKHYLAGDLNG